MKELNPIGVFDSGVGGVSVLEELTALMPYEHFVYFGDFENAPYGTKDPAEVLTCVRGVMTKLLSLDIKAVVIACNTATSAAAAALRNENTLPIIGMEPALKPACENNNGGRILVLATPVTLKLPKFELLMEKYGANAERVPCPGLMDLVENMDFEGAKAYLIDKLHSYDLSTIDSIVLGCTHYVFLKPVLKSILPQSVRLVDGNEGTAKQLRRVLENRGLLKTEGQGKITWLSGCDKQKETMQFLYEMAKATRTELHQWNKEK